MTKREDRNRFLSFFLEKEKNASFGQEIQKSKCLVDFENLFLSFFLSLDTVDLLPNAFTRQTLQGHEPATHLEWS